MTDQEFIIRSAQRIADASGTTVENRARVTLYDTRLRELRATHACLMRLPAHELSRVLHAALRADVTSHAALRHTNALGDTFYKYVK